MACEPDINLNFFETRTIPKFDVHFFGSNFLAMDFRRIARDQDAIRRATARLHKNLSLALWYESYFLQKHIEIELVPFELSEHFDQQEKYMDAFKCANTHTCQFKFDHRRLKRSNRRTKMYELAQIIDEFWPNIAQEHGVNSISILHIMESLIEERWRAKGRITPFVYDRKRARAAALFFDTGVRDFTLSLGIFEKAGRFHWLDVYKARSPSTHDLYAYGTKISWSNSNQIRIYAKSNALDLKVHVNGYAVSFEHYDKEYTRAEKHGGGLFKYDDSNAHLLLEQSPCINGRLIESPDLLNLPTSQEEVNYFDLPQRLTEAAFRNDPLQIAKS